MSEKTIKKEWLSRKFARQFSQPVLDITVETGKAYLLSDGKTEAWVPKAAVDRNNEAAMASKGKALQDRINIPLKEASPDEYKDVFVRPYELLPYQKDVVKTLEGKKRVYLGVEQGLGKTPISIARTKLFDDGKPTLLVCKKSLFKQWKLQIGKFCPELLDRFHLINYEMIWRDTKAEWMSQFHDGNFNLILEEVGRLGNEEAHMTDKCMELARECDNLQLLSGSFFGGRFEKCYPCTRMMGFTWNRKEFDKLFTIQVRNTMSVSTRWGRRKVSKPRVVGYRHISSLVNLMGEEGAVFVRVKDVFRVSGSERTLDPNDRKTLPKRIRNTVTVDMPSELKKLEESLYETMKGKSSDEINAGFSRLKVKESLANIPDKLDVVESLVSESDDRWCIMYQYTNERDALRKLLKKMGRPVSEMSGQVKDLDNYNDCSDSVTLLQVKTGQEGLDLPKCHRMIFTSIFSPDDVLQGEARIWRIGQRYPCFYYTLITNGKWDASKMDDLELSRKDVDNISSTL